MNPPRLLRTGPDEHGGESRLADCPTKPTFLPMPLLVPCLTLMEPVLGGELLRFPSRSVVPALASAAFFCVRYRRQLRAIALSGMPSAHTADAGRALASTAILSLMRARGGEREVGALVTVIAKAAAGEIQRIRVTGSLSTYLLEI